MVKKRSNWELFNFKNGIFSWCNCDLKGALKWKSCERTALNRQLMKHSDCHVHDNHMMLGITCCFVCFMFVGCAFMEMGKWRCFVSLNLECELSCLFVLVFALHEDQWEYGSDWCTGLLEDEELQTYKGWQIFSKGESFWVGSWGGRRWEEMKSWVIKTFGIKNFL